MSYFELRFFPSTIKVSEICTVELLIVLQGKESHGGIFWYSVRGQFTTIDPDYSVVLVIVPVTNVVSL